MAIPKRKGKRHDRIPAETVRDGLRDVLNRVEYKGERIIITRHAKESAALVSMADLERLDGAA